jgi:hypothetical protein
LLVSDAQGHGLDLFERGLETFGGDADVKLAFARLFRQRPDAGLIDLSIGTQGEAADFGGGFFDVVDNQGEFGGVDDFLVGLRDVSGSAGDAADGGGNGSSRKFGPLERCRGVFGEGGPRLGHRRHVNLARAIATERK